MNFLQRLSLFILIMITILYVYFSFFYKNNNFLESISEKNNTSSYNPVEASKEKHIPVYTVNGNEVTVRIGSVDHPMQDVHYIEWVVLQTKFGNQRRALNPNDAPEVKFSLLPNDEVVAVYAYCNLHGLWKA